MRPRGRESGQRGMIARSELSAEALGNFLATEMNRRCGSSHPRLTELVPFAAQLALECIANSDALYHNIEHTMLVTLAGHDIFVGRALLIPSTPNDYAHLIIACLMHDIGYVRGILEGTVSTATSSIRQAGKFLCREDRPTPRSCHITSTDPKCLCMIACGNSTPNELLVRLNSHASRPHRRLPRTKPTKRACWYEQLTSLANLEIHTICENPTPFSANSKKSE